MATVTLTAIRNLFFFMGSNESTKRIRLLYIVVKDGSYYWEVFFVLSFWLCKFVFFCKIEGLIILMEDL